MYSISLINQFLLFSKSQVSWHLLVAPTNVLNFGSSANGLAGGSTSTEFGIFARAVPICTGLGGNCGCRLVIDG